MTGFMISRPSFGAEVKREGCNPPFFIWFQPWLTCRTAVVTLIEATSRALPGLVSVTDRR